MFQLCLDIYLVRYQGEFELEEDLFSKLIFIFRSPEIMIKWTRMPARQRGGEEREEAGEDGEEAAEEGEQAGEEVEVAIEERKEEADNNSQQ